MFDANKIFRELLFKWKALSSSNIELNKTDYLISAENENEFILQVLERYVKDREHTIPSKLQEIVKVNFPDNSFLRLAENSSCSPDYIEKLVGWPTK
jgi:hypothetical protein